MPELITEPYLIRFTNGSTVEEYVGRDRNGIENVSVALLFAPPGWIEAVQRPEFDEITVVLSGALQVEHAGEILEVTEGQAIVTRTGETVQYSSPKGSRYLAICLPAFDATMANRAAPASIMERSG